MTVTLPKGRKNISSGIPYENVHGYSRAVRVGSDIHVSGTCVTKDYENCDAYEQAKVVLGIVEKALKDADAGFEHVVRTICYLRDIDDKELVARAHFEAFGEIKPATTIIQVASLFRPWQRIEIETYAKVSE